MNSLSLKGVLAAGAVSLAMLAAAAQAAEPDSCQKIRMADVGWTDNTAQNGLFNVVATALGYETKIDVLALPVIMEGLKNNNLDLFLDNWMPSNAANIQPYLDAKSLEMLPPDLTGAGYGPVVPKYVADTGIKGLKDLAANADKFDKKFYGIEPGNDGNKIIQKLIDDPNSGLHGWKLVESSEQGMLAQAQKAMSKKEWIVFLGWAPHPVMGKMDIVYLTGFEDDGFGAAQVHPLTRVGLSSQCPNLGKLLANLKFTLPMESAVMETILAGKDGDAAASEWLKANPEVLDTWLAGVTTVDGQDGAAAVRKSLGL
ncbi:MAG: choline ABC transporter substrate-binding protein [Rhodospirillaceae bacterium]|nr:choline ABC transporter substrate-binding protein [Rhodospirillaceae bacterium]